MEYRHPGYPSVKQLKTLMSASKVMFTIFWDASGVLYKEFLTKRLTVNSRQVLSNIAITQATDPQKQTAKKNLSFASQQCKTTLQCTNIGHNRKTDIHSGFTTSLQPRFGTFRL
ncbi:hypothetical protein TNCV_1567111 [Trichonephila clavipes]|nr:hypothetical protein TNCV_1567111 [Trichonephila clavipes]